MKTSSVNGSTGQRPIELETASPSGPGEPLDSSNLMPDPIHADVSMAIAEMVIESAFTARKAARQDRQLATEKMIAAQKAQITELRNAANEKFAAASLQAFGKMAEGAASIVGGGIAAAGTQQYNPKATANWADNAAPIVKAAGQYYGGVLNLASAFHSRDADLSETQAKTAEMEATRQKESLENANDDIDEAREHVRTALNFLREFKATEAETMMAAIRA